MKLKYCDITVEFDRWEEITRLTLENVVLKEPIDVHIDDLDEEFLRELNYEIKMALQNDPMEEADENY